MLTSSVIENKISNFSDIQSNTVEFDQKGNLTTPFHETHRVLNDGIFEKSLKDKILNSIEANPKLQQAKPKTTKRSLGKKHKKKHKKINKCIKKIFKGKKKHKFHKAKKLIMPILLGLFLLKSILISIVLKTLIFIASKGLLMGFFSTIMTSLLGFRGVFQNGHHHRKRDRPFEILRVPVKYADDIYYEKPYRRKDLIPQTVKGKKQHYLGNKID